jgi:hypothetical protein
MPQVTGEEPTMSEPLTEERLERALDFVSYLIKRFGPSKTRKPRR